MLYPLGGAIGVSTTKRGATSIPKKKSELGSGSTDENSSSGNKTNESTNPYTPQGKNVIPKDTQVQLGKLKNKTTRIGSFKEQEQKEPEKPVSDSRKPSEEEKEEVRPLTYENLKACWDEFIRQKQIAGKNSEVTILKQEFSLDEDGLTIQLPLMNNLQQDILDQFRQELLDYLREQLNTKGLRLTTYIVKAEEQQKRYYTPEEKFNYLLEKYPQLQKLKDKFGLDPDF